MVPRKDIKTVMSRNPPDPPGPGLELTAEVRVEQVRHFTESCLPSTMGLANRRKSQITCVLDESTAMFPFEDRVLIWLAPYWRKETEAFHQSDGPGMSEFEAHKLSRFDEQYWQTLKEKLKTLPSCDP